MRSATCKSVWHILRNISRVRNSLTYETCATTVQSYVMSRLDFCNALLYGAHDYQLERLQKVQNYAARVIARVPRYVLVDGVRKYQHITPTLAALHWLPIKQRVQYKTALHVRGYMALHQVTSLTCWCLAYLWLPVTGARTSRPYLSYHGPG